MRAELVDHPTGQDVLTFLGRSGGSMTQADAHVDHVTAMVRACTRGRGFVTGTEPKIAADLAAVIVTAAARLVTNPHGLREQEASGVATVTYNEFRGFNLAEQMVLNSHRRRAA